jgi:4-amino-4-deoxy-L-arabinose transferase-like glycosyltransferase
MKRQLGLFTIALVFGAAILLVPSDFARYCLAFVLLWVLPGLSWASLIPLTVIDLTEWLVVGLGLSFVVTPVTTLLIVYLPGSLTRDSLVAATVGVTGLPLVLSALGRLSSRTGRFPTASQVEGGVDAGTGERKGVPLSRGRHPLWQKGWAWLLAAVLIAVGLRFVNLDYSEFQGDEAEVMVRAAQALEGDDAILFQHKKGPAQLTLVMPGWRLTDVTNEWMARLPFAWVSVLGVVAVFFFGQRLGNPHAGGIAAWLIAIEGFLLGFGRIVQYQSIVFALSTLGLLCLLVFYQNGRASLVVAGAAFFAGGALAHYDAVLALPAGMLLVGARLWKDPGPVRRTLASIAFAALVGAAIVGLFYIPFMRSDYIGNTSSYMSSRIGGQVYNNLQSTFELSAVYDSVYLLGVFFLAVVVQLLITWARWGRVGLVASSVLVLAAISGWLWPERWVFGDLTLVWIPAAGLLLGAALAPDQPMGMHSLWLWLGFPAMFYLFFVALPLTHVYTVFPALALLTGITAVDLGRWLAARSRPAMRVAAALGAGLFLICSFYAVMMFVDHTPEYRRTFPENKHAFYWTPYEQMPQEGLFGFPYRAGWKVVGYLMDEGELNGTYDSNEEQEVTDYYMRKARRLGCATPDMYITALDVQDEVPVRWDQIGSEYHPAVVVTVDGKPKLTVHMLGSVASPQAYRAEAYAGFFDRGSTPERITTAAVSEEEPDLGKEFVPLENDLGQFARLLGYSVDTTHAAPGGYVELTLLWQAERSISADYHVFTHLHDGQSMWGQLDGQPVCGTLPTSEWEPGQYVVDPYRIAISDEAPPGAVPLTVGMYDLATMQRLPVTASDGAPAGDYITISEVEIH